MPIKLALPVMHITSGNYLPFAGKYMQGRDFFQPLASLKVSDIHPAGGTPFLNAHLADDVTKFYAPGIEMFFHGTDAEVSKVYSMFDGVITIIGTRLILTPEFSVLKSLASTKKIVEAGLGRVIYENIEMASFKTAISSLILTSFQAANNHPLLKIAILDGTPAKATTVGKLLTTKAAADRPATVDGIVTKFLAGGQALQVNAGDLLGKANFFASTDFLPEVTARPAWFKTAADADRARRILIITKDVGKQVLNPWYYLHNYNTPTTTITSSPASHPLLLGTAPTYGREKVGTAYLFPMGDLNTLHGVPGNDPDSTHTFVSKAKNKWKYNDIGKFEALQPNKTGALVPFKIEDGATEQSKFKSLRTKYLTFLNSYCEKLQIPVELMFGILGAEAKTATAVRLEPLQSANEKLLTKPEIDQYNKLIGFHCKTVDVSKDKDDFRFAVEKTEDIGAIFPSNNKSIDAPMRFYYATGKYWLISNINIKVQDKFPTGFLGSQGFGETLYYNMGKRKAGHSAFTDAKIKVKNSGDLQLDMTLNEELLISTNLDADIKITIWVNDVATSWKMTIPEGELELKDPDLLEQSIGVKAGDTIAMSVETGGTKGQITGLNIKFKIVSVSAIISKNLNKANPNFSAITNVPAGMVAPSTMKPGTTKYFQIGVPGAGDSDQKKITAFTAPGDGFLLISDFAAVSNTLKKEAHVTILKKDTGKYSPTKLVGSIPAGKIKDINVPFSQEVKTGEEFMLEITTQAEKDAPATVLLGAVTIKVFFIPFNKTESFLTSKHGYSFDLATVNRSVSTARINTENGRSTTWDELYSVIRKTKGLRISIGPAQTLISTAMGTAKSQLYNIVRLIPSFVITDPIDFFNYLGDPEKSLAIAVALIRSEYNFPDDEKSGQNVSTQFDIPLVATTHNFGRKGRGFKSGTNNWGVEIYKADQYMKNAGAMFNMAVQKANIDFIPTVQFKK